MSDLENQDFSLHSGMDVVDFTGVRVGHSSTAREASLRWTEINIYKTIGGSYITQSVGKSIVYHRSGTPCARGKETSGSDIPPSSEPCEVCDAPYPDDQDFDSSGTYRHEIELSAVTTISDPREIRTVLMVSNKDGSKRLAPVATYAIQDAIDNDPDLRGVFGRKIYVN